MGRPSLLWTPVLALALLACSEEGSAPPTHYLMDALDEARVEVDQPLLPPGCDVVWVAHGMAGLRVSLAADARREEALDGGEQLSRWTLPLPAADHGGRASAQPELVGLPLERIVGKQELGPTQHGGFWLEGAELAIVKRPQETFPESFGLVYPVAAAHLAGTVHVSGYPNAEIFRAQHLRGDVATESLVLPAGSRTTLPVHRAENARLGGRFVLGGKREPVRIELAWEDRVLLETVLSGEEGELVLELPGKGTGQLSLRVEGNPETLVLWENASLIRTRAKGDPPNVLLVLIDTLRADRLEHWGQADGLTPGLDALCAESLRFEECWATSSWTLPSVATILTSRHAGEHRAWLENRRLGEGLDTLAEVLRRAGYRTAAFTGGAYVGPRFGLERGFAHFDGRGGGVQQVVARARRFLAEHKSGEPWFCLVHTYEVHAPYEPPAEPQRFDELSADGTLVPEETAELFEELYDEAVHFTDETLGEWLGELKEQGLLERTLLCVTSDHGEEFGEHGLLGHGDTLYVEQLHVPLFLRFPDGARAGEVDTRPVSLVDLAPTLLDAVGLAQVLKATTMGGRSLLAEEAPSPVYAVRQDELAGPLEALRSDVGVWLRGRFLRPAPRPDQGLWQYYDLVGDPGQRQVLLHDPAKAPSGSAEAALAERLQALSRVYMETRVSATEAAPDVRGHRTLERLGFPPD